MIAYAVEISVYYCPKSSRTTKKPNSWHDIQQGRYLHQLHIMCDRYTVTGPIYLHVLLVNSYMIETRRDDGLTIHLPISWREIHPLT